MDPHVLKYVLAEWADAVRQVADGNDPLMEAGYANFYQTHCDDLRRMTNEKGGD
jgi:hypothetical protein